MSEVELRVTCFVGCLDSSFGDILGWITTTIYIFFGVASRHDPFSLLFVGFLVVWIGIWSPLAPFLSDWFVRLRVLLFGILFDTATVVRFRLRGFFLDLKRGGVTYL